MPAFVVAIFLSAFLLFQVQPIIARYILPWYGGSPAVWTTCMLFFQAGLLIGYSYAHGLVSAFRERPKVQAGIYLASLLVALAILPITPADDLKPATATVNPVPGILHLLLVTVGLPYVVIAASGPLLQHWFGELVSGKSPYRLYAISNFGSLLGLLTYPVLIEPNLRLGQQTGLWSGGFVTYTLIAGLCGWLLIRKQPVTPPIDSETSAATTSGAPAKAPPARGFDRFLWVALAACGSLLMLAATNQMCQDVAVVPFLWVLPLSLYLLTFIIAFDHARWYYRPLWIPLAALSIGALVYLLKQDYADDEILLAIQIAIYMAAMFTGCMVCHGEMVRLKPAPRYLTGFYLAVALGGALGGGFVSLVAPRLFKGYWELHLGLMVVVVLAGVCLLRDQRRREVSWPALAAGGGVGWLAALLVLGFYLRSHITDVAEDGIVSKRSFYGILHVYEWDVGTEHHNRVLYHGRINHGRQMMDEEWRRWPGGYYSDGSAPGILFDTYPDHASRQDSGPLNYGVVGLGIGTLSAYAGTGDHVRIYEINPQVEDIARNYFTFLEDCEGDLEVVLGDARMSLEREVEAADPMRFDLLFLDAFSGDSVPIHLLTREAFELYFQRLKPNGVLVVHISNLHLDLSDPVRTIADQLGKQALQIEHDPDSDWANYSVWVLVSDNGDLFDDLREKHLFTPWASPEPKHIPWTDDYSNLFQVLYWD